MNSIRENENVDLKYIKNVISQVMGQDLWNGFYDVVSSEKPKIDLYDDGISICLVAEAPGIMDVKDISVTVSTNKITIRGTMKDRYQHHKPGKVLKSECLYGSFNRTVELPYPVDESTIKATYESGLLEINLKRLDSDGTRPIEIEFKK